MPQNQKDPFQILESLRKTIELDNLTRSKSIDELSAKLKDTEAAKEKLREEFKNELQVEQQIRRFDLRLNRAMSHHLTLINCLSGI